MFSTFPLKLAPSVSEQQLLKFVRAEIRAEREQVYQGYYRPIQARVTDGICLSRLYFLYEQLGGGFVYHYKDNATSFQFAENDLVVVNDGTPEGEAIGDGTLMWIGEINHLAKTMVLDYALELPEGKEPPTKRDHAYQLDKGFFDFNSASLLNSIKIAFNDCPNLQSLVLGERLGCQQGCEGFESVDSSESIEFGQVNPRPSNVLYLSSLLKGSQDKLTKHRPKFTEPDTAQFTEQQRIAYEKAFSQTVSLIQGPPGTGKTHLLAQIILRAIREQKKILVTAYTHAAINNLLEAVESADSFNITAGSLFKLTGRAKSKTLPKSIEQMQFDTETIANLLRHPVIVGATAYQAYKIRQYELPLFDMIVIDEAAQMPIPHALAAMICGDNYVLAGDHKQLPPILKAHEPEDEVAKSIFERMHNLYPELNVQLNTTFRMNRQINEFPSKTFYKGQLQPSPQCAERRLTTKTEATAHITLLQRIIARDESVTFVEVQHTSSSKVSRSEAEVVARIACNLLVEHNIRPSDLGIISPHKQHNNEIKRRIAKLLNGVPDWPVKSTMKQLTVDTVEKMQGREREVVILSLCSSKRSYLEARAAFLYKPNRLNVAITRCRSRLFVVGSKHFFPAVSRVRMNPKHAKVFNDYHEYLKQHLVLIEDEDADLPFLTT